MGSHRLRCFRGGFIRSNGLPVGGDAMTDKPVNPCRHCGKPQRAKGLCLTCYQRNRRRALGVKPTKKVGGELVKALVPSTTARKIEHMATLRGCSVAEVVRSSLIKAFGL